MSVPDPFAPAGAALFVPAGADYAWSIEPPALAAIAVAGGVYAWRARQLAAEPTAAHQPLGPLRIAAFAGGLAVAFLALISPLDQLGAERLFSAHMVQHLLLADLMPILLLLGLTRAFLRPAVRRLSPIEEALGPLAHPLAALLLYVSVMWAWHLPAMYELALEHPLAHSLEHLTFFATGMAFWWFVIEPVPPRQRLHGPWSIAYLTAAKLLMGALGLVLAFSPSVIYPFYERAPRTWGLSPLEDLNVGGLIMMLEQSIVLVVFFAILFARMLERSEQAQRRRERFEATHQP